MKAKKPIYLVILDELPPNDRAVYDARTNRIRIQHRAGSRWAWCWFCDLLSEAAL
jgi:hypothetical protein